jgi:hypothetical protein
LYSCSVSSSQRTVVDVEVVGRLVEQQQVRMLEQCAAQAQRGAFSPPEQALTIFSPGGKCSLVIAVST